MKKTMLVLAFTLVAAGILMAEPAAKPNTPVAAPEPTSLILAITGMSALAASRISKKR